MGYLSGNSCTVQSPCDSPQIRLHHPSYVDNRHCAGLSKQAVRPNCDRLEPGLSGHPLHSDLAALGGENHRRYTLRPYAYGPRSASHGRCHATKAGHGAHRKEDDECFSTEQVVSFDSGATSATHCRIGGSMERHTKQCKV